MGKLTSGPQKAAIKGFQAPATPGRETSHAKSSHQSVSWHPIPIQLVDEVMPRLKDTELRVLLVVLRQTWGWKADRTKTDDTRQTKRRDWLSHRQLCRRTGRGSDAVSGAVATLTASGLIVVEDAAGRSLITPEERRRCMDRQYFRPGGVWTGEQEA